MTIHQPTGRVATRSSVEDQSDVRLEHVAKRFEDVVAVDDLSLEIAKGEFFSLLGPSGCGKTTTLRMIGGFEEPSAGTVYLANQDVTNLPPYRRAVNTVFQSYALFPHLDVFENVAFGLRRRKVGRSEAAVRVREVLRLVDLAGFERRRPTQLSGGQQQRVALARALVNEPMVLLLDEPLGALDLKLRKQMQLELKRIQREVQLTFLYVTHDQEEAMTMSDHLAVMRHGRIEQIGEPEDVYESPATEFVAGFLGASNLLDGTLQDGPGDPAAVRLADGTLVRAPRARLDGLGSRVRVGVRPEKIHLSRADGSGGERPRPDGWNELQGTVRAAAYIGVSYQYVVDGPGGTTLTVYAQNLGNQDAPAPGGRATLRWRPEHTFAVPMAADRGEEDEER